MVNEYDTEYLNLVSDILRNGDDKSDRTGVGTRSVFDRNLRFCLDMQRPVDANGTYRFPLVTAKYTNFRVIVEELRWMLSGSTNTNDLDAKIWDAWADAHGELGPIYGSQWRGWPSMFSDRWHDQIARIESQLVESPDSRRIILSAWNVDDLQYMALQPCHVMAQFVVDGRGRLNCKMTQRSADVFLGLPFNIAQYALLTRMFAKVSGWEPGDLAISLGDAHIYHNHMEQAEELAFALPYHPPTVKILGSPSTIDEIDMHRDIALENYDHGPRMKAPVAV